MQRGSIWGQRRTHGRVSSCLFLPPCPRAVCLLGAPSHTLRIHRYLPCRCGSVACGACMITCRASATCGSCISLRHDPTAVKLLSCPSQRRKQRVGRQVAWAQQSHQPGRARTLPTLTSCLPAGAAAATEQRVRLLLLCLPGAHQRPRPMLGLMLMWNHMWIKLSLVSRGVR